MEEAERLCDRVAILAAGHRVCEGSPAALIADRLAREAVEFDSTHDEEARLLDPGVRRMRAGSRVFAYAERAAPIAERIRRCDGGDRRDLVIRPTNLEDVFLAATGTRLEGGA
jgi:ABC-type multidrug transport system ATPase subunit